jgi:hypothetical protein
MDISEYTDEDLKALMEKYKEKRCGMILCITKQRSEMKELY